MATVRPTVTVYDVQGKEVTQVAAPAVFSAPIRADIVSVVHSNMAKNRRQAYAVKYGAGMQHSAESWGVGRSLSRIPRVAGGGTSRSGQGAFGNMCRKGRMFAPTKTWRKWHRKTQLNQKRFATVSALAASAVPALVIARGHSIGRVSEVPLVVDNAAESIAKTSQLIKLLQVVGAGADVARASRTRQVRSGRSHQRARVHTGRLGPLIVYNNNRGIARAARNIPGVEAVSVRRLNLLQLAPSGQLGRFVVFTQGAVEQLNNIFGTQTEESKVKGGYKLPRAKMTNADIDRIINSTEIQKVLRKKRAARVLSRPKLNPLTNFKARVALNPYALVARRAEVAASVRARKQRDEKRAQKREPVAVKPLTEATLKKIAAAEQYQKARRANLAEKRAYIAKKFPQ